MNIKNYKEGDELKILELFKNVFKQDLGLDNWLWRFRDNPAGKYLIKLMWDKDKLVGHYAVSPLVMVVENIEVLTALSLTTMTHPDYQGMGIFSELSNSLYQDLDNLHQCKAIWGFPNNNSHYGFIKKLGWNNLALVHSLAISSENIKPKGIAFSRKEISLFNNSHVKFINKKITTFAICYVKHSILYLNWRLINKPNSKYKTYEFDSNSGKAILVVKPYFNSKSGNYVLNIIASFMDNYSEIQDYLISIFNDFDVKFKKITIWKNLWDPAHLELEKQRFVLDIPQTYLSAKVHPSMPRSYSDFKTWNISMSYSDVF